MINDVHKVCRLDMSTFSEFKISPTKLHVNTICCQQKWLDTIVLPHSVSADTGIIFEG